MKKNNRQIGTTLDEIRDDYLARYRFAASAAKRKNANKIVDVGSGTGYGAYILAQETDAQVISVDIDPEILEYGEEHFSHERVTRVCADLANYTVPECDVVTMFELLEHLEHPDQLLSNLDCGTIVGSVPNQTVVPFVPEVYIWHHRHYTSAELTSLLHSSGWRHVNLFGQVGKHGNKARVDSVKPNAHRTLILIGKR